MFRKALFHLLPLQLSAPVFVSMTSTARMRHRRHHHRSHISLGFVSLLCYFFPLRYGV